MSVKNTNEYLLKTVKLNRFMIVNVRSSDETRHVYSPASSSDTSDKIRLHVQAYLNIRKNNIICFLLLTNGFSYIVNQIKYVTYVCSSIYRCRSSLARFSPVFVTNKRPPGP